MYSEENKSSLVSAEETESGMPSLNTERKPGGLYRHVHMSVKTANWLIAFGIGLLVVVMLFAVNHSGFTVSFDTNGGSHIESVKVMHGEIVPMPETPVKEGFVFSKWYQDAACTQEWNMETDTAVGNLTLYAGWLPKTHT